MDPRARACYLKPAPPVRLSTTKRLRDGIFTAGNVVAFITAFSATTAFSCSNQAITAYVSFALNVPSAFWGIARRM